MKKISGLTKQMSFIITLFLLCCVLVSCTVKSDTPNYEELPELDYTADRANKEVNITGDGSIPNYIFYGLQPYFDQTGATMLPMVHFDELFQGNINYKIDDNTVTITKNVLDVITVVSVMADSNILIRDGKEIVMNTTPVLKDGTLYVPLEFVGQALGYGVYWDEILEWVQFYQYDSVYVYIWNENEDSSSRGIKYSYIISGDHTEDMDKIKTNVTSNFDDVKAVLKNLPQGAEILTTKIYRTKGYDVPYKDFNIIIEEISDMGLKSSSTDYCLDKTTLIIKDLSKAINEWYSQELFALDEEAIYDSKSQIYRFSYFPSFSDPFVVRIEIKSDGTADVYYKIGKGNAYGDGGGISKSKTAKLSIDETNEFLELLDRTKFWELTTEDDDIGLDGYDVCIEGVKDEAYHIINRWCPDSGDKVVYSIEEYFNALKQKLDN